MKPTRSVTIEVQEEYLERLDAIAIAANRSVSEIAGEALAVYLDAQLWQDAAIKRTLEDIAAGARSVDHDRVVAWIESWDTENELRRPM
jgi:predicted transcriptional regulator